MESFCGLMGQLIKVNFISIKLKDMVTTSGLMVENMKDYGKITRCMAEAFLRGLMADNMKANIT